MTDKAKLNVGVFETDRDGNIELIAAFGIGFDAQLFVQRMKESLPEGSHYHIEVVRYDVEWC